MRTVFGLCAAAMLLLLTACRTVDSGERGFRDLPSEERDRAAKASEALGDGILQAFRDGDFSAFRRSAPGEMARQMTEADFAASRRRFGEKFGEIRDFRFLTSLDTPAFGNLIWVVTFVRSGTNGKEIRRQLLFRLVTMQTDGKPQVVSCGFL